MKNNIGSYNNVIAILSRLKHILYSLYFGLQSYIILYFIILSYTHYFTYMYFFW